MRKEKALTALLKELVNLLAEESARSPDFGARLDQLLESVPEPRKVSRKKAAPAPPEPLPNLHAEWRSRGETDFRLWLRDLPLTTLRAIIRTEDCDPAKRTGKWRSTEKLAEFVFENFHSRLHRGERIGGSSSETSPPG